MKKRHASLIVLLALAFTLCFGAFVACGNDEQPATQYTLTWDVNSNVTLTMEGYDTLPTKVNAGTELKFTLEAKAGWMVTTVTPANIIRQQSDGSYTMTVGKDLSIKVNAREILESLNVVQNKTMYAGDTVKEGDLTVTAHYASNRDEEIPFGNYSVDYGKAGGQDATALQLGSTSIKVSYNNEVEAELTFTTPIKALIKLDLYGGTLSEAALVDFKDLADYEYNTNDGIVSWTISATMENAIELPIPTKAISGNPFPFKSWSGATKVEATETDAEKWTIPAGTDTSKTITATYDVQLVQIDSMGFSVEEVTTEDGTAYIPYLTIEGEFIAAESAYLYLFEGNDNVDLKGDEVEKAEGSDAFKLKFDLRKLVESGYIGKWMDIKFQAKFGEREETQEINLNNYDDDFVDLNESVRGVSSDGNWYSFGYKVHTPNNSTDRLLKLVYTSAMPWDLSAELIQKDREVPAEEEGGEPTMVPTAYIKISGVVDEHATFTEDELKAAVQGTTFGMLSDGDWSNANGTPVVTVVDAKHFYVEYNLNNTANRKNYFMHYPDGNTNLTMSVCPVVDSTVKIGAWTYTLSSTNGAIKWDTNLLCIEVFNESALYVGTTEYDVVVEDGKVYLKLDGEFNGGKTSAEIKALIEQVDFEMDGNSSNLTVVDAEKVVVTVNDEDKTFTITAEIPELGYGKYWTHVKGLIGDVRPKSGTNATTSDGTAYKYFEEGRDNNKWTARLLHVAEVLPADVSSVKLETEGTGDDAKLYYVIEYTKNAFATKEQVEAQFEGASEKLYFDLQQRGGAWTTYKDFAVTITIADNGNVTVKFDISAIADQNVEHFTTHYELVPVEGTHDFKAGIDSFTNPAVEYKGKNYVMRFVKGSGAESDFWGCVGIDVTAA